MNKLISLVFSAVVVSTCGTALAGSVDVGTQRVIITASDSQMRAATLVRTTPSFEGVYAMSTGRSLQILSGGDTVRVRYGRQRPMALRYDGHGAFASADGAVVLKFIMDDFEEPIVASLLLPSELS
jgi:hypothetical protein